MDGVVRQYNEIGGGMNMKITTKEGTVFEGTQAEYEAFLAFAERNLSKQKVETAHETTEVVEEITFGGAKYRKVDREAQAGDVVVYRENTSYCFLNGKPYLVESRFDDIQVDAGGRNFYNLYSDLYRRSPETVDVYEKLESKYVPQDGDIVVVTGNTSCSENKVGDIGKITKIGKYNRVKVEVPGKSVENIWTKNGEFRKATSAEVDAYEKALHKPKFKAGDSVVFESDELMRGIIIGKVYVAKLDRDGDLYVTNEYGDSKCFAMSGSRLYGKPRHATATELAPKLKAGDFVIIDTARFTAFITKDKAYEVFENSYGLYFLDDVEDVRYKALEVGAYTIVDAEEANWAKIGRKVGEFREGDIVRAENLIAPSVDIGPHIGVIEDVGGKLVGIRYANGQYYGACKANNNVKLIAPVEATFK